MNGHIYSNMPDTTRRVSPYRRSIRRLVASTSLFVSSLLLVASMGVAQENVSCKIFDSPEAAMEYVASNPEAESSLDSDGDGTVCNEDPSLFTQSRDTTQKDEFAQVMQETTQDTESTSESTSEDTTANTDDTQGGSEDNSGSSPTPNTGGMELLPLAGSMLTAMFGGFMLLRRR